MKNKDISVHLHDLSNNLLFITRKRCIFGNGYNIKESFTVSHPYLTFQFVTRI